MLLMLSFCLDCEDVEVQFMPKLDAAKAYEKLGSLTRLTVKLSDAQAT